MSTKWRASHRPSGVASLLQGFAPGAKRVFHMAPPILARAVGAGGMRRKIALKGWFIVPLMHVLRHGKILRGTVLDPFGRQADRQLERRLIIEFERDVDAVLERLSLTTMDDAVALIRLYEKVRGFGHIKMRHFEEARPEFDAFARRSDAVTDDAINGVATSVGTISRYLPLFPMNAYEVSGADDHSVSLLAWAAPRPMSALRWSQMRRPDYGPSLPSIARRVVQPSADAATGAMGRTLRQWKTHCACRGE